MPEPADKPQVVSLYVVAGDGAPLRGADIHRAAEETELQYGDMEIYHHYGPGGGLPEPLFSMADMLKPGTFDRKARARHETEGLCLFMRLSTPLEPALVFEWMLNAADRLAGLLAGEIHGQAHTLLAEDEIRALRRKLQKAGHA